MFFLSLNAQNWRFVIVRERAQKEKIPKIWRKTWGFYLDTFATAGLRPGETAEQREKTKRIASELADHIADVKQPSICRRASRWPR